MAGGLHFAGYKWQQQQKKWASFSLWNSQVLKRWYKLGSLSQYGAIGAILVTVVVKIDRPWVGVFFWGGGGGGWERNKQRRNSMVGASHLPSL